MLKLLTRFLKIPNGQLQSCVSLNLYRSWKQNVSISHSALPHSSERRPVARYLSAATTETPEDEDDDNLMDPQLITELISDESELNSLKHILYANSDDHVILKMNGCSSSQELLEVVLQNESTLLPMHLTQCIILMWNLKKHSKNRNMESISAEEYAAFGRLFPHIQNAVKKMDSNELTCSLLYLNKIGFAFDHSIIECLLEECFCRMDDKRPEIFPLNALSRFCVALHSSGDYYASIMARSAISRILTELDQCETSENFKLVTICFSCIFNLITPTLLSAYKKKLSELIKSGAIDKHSTKCILKIVHFLNLPYWSAENTEITRNLLVLIKNSITSFQERDLMSVFKVFMGNLEPAEIMPLITEKAERLLQQDESPSADLLVCAVLYTLPEKRQLMINIAKKLIYSNYTQESSTLLSLFKALRLLKISNVALCDAYWSKVLAQLKSNKSEREDFRLARICHRYMHFNNNLGGTYRHIEFEKFISAQIMTELGTGTARFIPSKFAKLSSFIIGYGLGGGNQEKIPDLILMGLRRMKVQFRTIDCVQLSRGMQIAYQLRFKSFMSPSIGQQYSQIDEILNETTEQHLKSPSLNVQDLNMLLRSFLNRRSTLRSPLFQTMMEKFETIDIKLTSRLLRDITFNLNACNYRHPSLCDQLVQYVIDNRDFVIGDTAEKVISCCFHHGHTPSNEKFFASLIHIIQRDFNFMSGLSIVQACLALSYFRALSEFLINRVFNATFIQRLENEIEMCYSKATYPERVLNQVMQLNRTVCLDYPEMKVPWFQQNYIEAQLSKLPTIENRFHLEFKSLLQSIAAEPKMITIDHFTPYGYKIDFLVYIDQEKNIISPPTEDKLTKLTSIAILLIKSDSFYGNNFKDLHGTELLRQRHLEILGYKVIHIYNNTWDTFSPGENIKKVEYVKSLLEIG